MSNSLASDFFTCCSLAYPDFLFHSKPQRCSTTTTSTAPLHHNNETILKGALRTMVSSLVATNDNCSVLAAGPSTASQHDEQETEPDLSTQAPTTSQLSTFLATTSQLPKTAEGSAEYIHHAEILHGLMQRCIATEFQLFPLLPTEIRLRIWRFALTEYKLRMVISKYNKVAPQLRNNFHSNETLKCWVQGPRHAAKFACREAFQAAQHSDFHSLVELPDPTPSPTVMTLPGPKIVFRGRIRKVVNFKYEDLMIGPWEVRFLYLIIENMNINNLRRLLLVADNASVQAIHRGIINLRSRCPTLEHIVLWCGYVPNPKGSQGEGYRATFRKLDHNLADFMDTWI
jgi:2EXR family